VNGSTANAIHAAATDCGKLMTLVAGKRWRSLPRPVFFTGGDDEMFMTRSLNVTLKTIEQHLIVPSGKYAAEGKIITDALEVLHC